MINSPVAKIKERLTIEEVVSSYITLTKAGSTLRANCPFHNEKTPSFFVSPDRGTYYCFGCAAGGDIFTFVEEFEGLDFKGTLKLLAERAGVPLTPFNKEDQKNQSEKERLYEVMEESTKFFEKNINENVKVQEYLKSRGLAEKTIKDFRVGFIDADWRILHIYLRSKNFSDIEIEKAGLTKKTDKGYYDRFRGRVMFPVMDSSGRVIAFSGRIFEDDGKSAKYLNSPETPIFSKSAVLYGIDKAKESIRKNNFSILVEGQMDLILSHQAGYRNTVATSGTALSDATVSKENAVSNLGLIKRISNNLVLGFDGDKAGINATKRAGKIALALGMDVKVAGLPEGVDPADLISKEGSDAWKESIKSSKHLIEFVLSKVIKDCGNDTRKVGREIKETVLPFVHDLDSAIEKSFFLKKISDTSGIPTTALQDDLSSIAKDLKNEKKEVESIQETKRELFRKDYIIRRLLGIMFWQETLKSPIVDVAQLTANIKGVLGSNLDEIVEGLGNNKEDYIFEAEVFYTNESSLLKEVNELFNNLKEEYLKEELAGKVRELSEVEESKDSQKMSEVLKEYQIIINKMESLKNEKTKN
ncbi:MAG: DNA primase [bacterium]|nr:DNA primase [bacterium]